jgi:hypothetical protein
LAEIQNFGVAAVGDENVGGLDVAVDDALGVGGVERVGNFDAEIEKKLQIQGTSADGMFQRFAVETFHGQVGLAVGFSDVVDGANVGMIQRGGGARFATEALERLRVFGQFIGEEFQGDEAAEVGVLSLVHHTHAATAELFDDAVMRDGLANE